MPIQRSFRSLVRTCLAAALLCGVLAVPALLAAQQPYKILDRWKLGGEGGWDYLAVDSPAHRLYLTHGVKVDVVDTQTGKLAGNIAGFKGTHGVVFDTTGKFGFISDGGGNAVAVFDRATLATVASIPAGTNPDGMVFEPATQTVWAFNGRSKNVSVIDAASQKVVATIPLPGKPEFPVADGKGTIFVNIEDKNEIVRLDAAAKKMTAEWPIKGCESPSGLAFDIAGARLFPVCDGKKMGVVDANTGKTLATPRHRRRSRRCRLGCGPQAGLRFVRRWNSLRSRCRRSRLSHHREPSHAEKRTHDDLRRRHRPHLPGRRRVRSPPCANRREPPPPCSRPSR